MAREDILLRILSLVLPILGWYLAVDLLQFTAGGNLASLTEITTALYDAVVVGQLIDDISATVYRWIVGFVIGAGTGVILGFWIGHSKRLDQLTQFPVDFLRSIPVTALLPLFLLFFGVGDDGKIAMAAVPSLLLLLVYVSGGVKRCSIARRQMAQSFGATPLQIFLRITLPETFPSLLLGLRLAISLSLVVAIVSEMFLGTNFGLGQRIFEAYMTNSAAVLYAHILVIGTLGYLLATVISALETGALHWVGR